MQQENYSSKINETIKNSLKNLGEMVDVDTVIGTPIKTENETIIPFSDVTTFHLCGGGEYGKITLFKNGSNLPFSAGNGALISIKPCGFLVKEKGKSFKVLSASNQPINKIIDKTMEIIDKSLYEE